MNFIVSYNTFKAWSQWNLILVRTWWPSLEELSSILWFVFESVFGLFIQINSLQQQNVGFNFLIHSSISCILIDVFSPSMLWNNIFMKFCAISIQNLVCIWDISYKISPFILLWKGVLILSGAWTAICLLNCVSFLVFY